MIVDKNRKPLSRKKKRKYLPITDEEVLGLIQCGALCVNTQTAQAWWADRPDHMLKPSPCHRDYQHVRLYRPSAKPGIYRRRSVAIHKLVWMAANMQLVPLGFEVHHKDQRRLPNGDRKNWISNLELLDCDSHTWYHQWADSQELRRAYKTFQEFRDWKRTQPRQEEIPF